MAPSERLLKDKAPSRFNMVNCQLRPNGVGEARLIQAFESVPMEMFVSPAIQSLVYADADLPLAEGPTFKRWLLAPLTLGKLLQLADIQPDDTVLVVGCGSGYSLALVAHLAAHVVGIESHDGLAALARTYTQEQKIPNIQVVTGALGGGYPEGGPYDVILVEGAVGEIPLVLTQQLCPQHGRLVVIMKGKTGFGQAEFGKGVLVMRTEDTLTQVAKFDANCPYLPEFEPLKGFQL
ncbi:MAG: methyltransferase protein [Alphaproteobacteria bacterium]|jgi:protein-L-isoaspartate(D-aspartate) O-methyltransferase|nr:methyltransferase protein [Alphaproteobacteria bacterium]